MIYSNLKPGRYQFPFDGKMIQPEIGPRNAQNSGDHNPIATDAYVATEAQVVLTQAQQVFRLAAEMNDSVFDLNNQDTNTVILNNAPIMEDGAVGPLGGPQAKGFVTGKVTDRGGELRFQQRDGETLDFSGIQHEDGSARYSRADQTQVLSIDISPKGVVDVEVTKPRRPGPLD